MVWDSTKVFHRALPHKTVEHPGARPIVTSSAALHEVKFPKLIGRDGWVWEAPSDREIPPKNLGKRPGRKPAFEMKTTNREVKKIESYIFLIKIIAVVR